MLQRTLQSISKQLACPRQVYAVVSRAAPVVQAPLIVTLAAPRNPAVGPMDAPQGQPAQTGSPTRSPKRRRLSGTDAAAPAAAAAAAAASTSETQEHQSPAQPAAPLAAVPAAAAATRTPNGAAAPAAVDAGAKQGGKPGKKPKGIAGDPKKERLHQIVHGIHMSAKDNDLTAAMNFFEGAVAEGFMPIRLAELNTLMYLAVGGDRWETLARGTEPNAAAVANVRGETAAPAHGAAGGAEEEGESISARRARHVTAATRVWEVMQEHKVKPDAGTFLALARCEGIRQAPEAAIKWVHTAKEAGQPLQLRLFHPALVGYCLQHKSDKIMEIDAYISKQGLECLDLTEYEFARLVEGLAADPAATWLQLRRVLQRMARELNELAPTTLELLSAFFASPRGAAALVADADLDRAGTQVPRSAWRAEMVSVDGSGSCEAAGGTLQRVELEEPEWESFAQGVASLGQKDDRGKRDFSAYMEWLARNGPYDILIDCANVAFYGQNRAGGGFNWGQVMRMVDVVKRAHPDKRLLVMVHRKRLYDPEAKVPEVQAFLDSLRAQKAFYYTPPGSNDDWYWMYAAVTARSRGMLISNDELRDHIWSLLRPKHFLKWKAGHITHYSFPGADTYPTLLPPPSFTSCVQRLEESGAWMFPSTEEGRWLCVRPV